MLRFFAVEMGSHDDWNIHFVLAVSLEDAGERFTKRIKKYYATWLGSDHYKGTTATATVYETDFDEFGVLQRFSDLGDRQTLKIKVPY